MKVALLWYNILSKSLLFNVEQKNFAFVFYSRWFLLASFLVLLFLLTVYGRAWYQEYQINQEISNLQNQLISLEAQKSRTLELLKYVQSQEFVEAKARTELNLVKEGENSAIIAGEAPPVDNRQEQELVVESNNQSNIIKWFKYFFN